MPEKIVLGHDMLRDASLIDSILKQSPSTIIIHKKLIDPFLEQNSQGAHLKSLEILKAACSKKGISLEISGTYEKHKSLEMQEAELAFENGAAIMTSDKTLKALANIFGVETIISGSGNMGLEPYFDAETMSVHLKEGAFAYAKKGSPGRSRFVKIGKELLTKENLENIFQSLLNSEETIVEKHGHASIVQHKDMRVIFTRQPMSEKSEMTAVRPIRHMDLEEYDIDERLAERLKGEAEGILVAGSPGQGKTTFARALALEYARQGFVVKTLESPRDMMLPENITQYSLDQADSVTLRDILLLSRPDRTVFDEMRNTEDFRLFSDLRLSGVGMIGIVHATKAVDAIQRFIGRIELGVIPQIIDTIIFIKDGSIEKVFSIEMTVKVPHGMTENDLARPIILVKDFTEENPEYEIYTYGDEAVVVPVSGQIFPALDEKKKKRHIEDVDKLLRKISKDIRYEFSQDKLIIYVPESQVKILKESKAIKDIEKITGKETIVEEVPANYDVVNFVVEVRTRDILLKPEKDMPEKEIELYIDDAFVMKARISKKNQVKVTRESEQGNAIYFGLKKGRKIEMRY